MDDFFQPQVIELKNKLKSRISPTPRSVSAVKIKKPKPPKAETLQQRLELKNQDGTCAGCSLCKVKRIQTEPPPPGYAFDSQFIYANRTETGKGNKNSDLVFLVDTLNSRADFLINYLERVHGLDLNSYYMQPALKCLPLPNQKKNNAVAPYISCNILHVNSVLKEIKPKVIITFGSSLYSLTKEKETNCSKCVYERLYSGQYNCDIFPAPDLSYFLEKRDENYYFQDNWYRHILDSHIKSYKAKEYRTFNIQNIENIISSSEENANEIIWSLINHPSKYFAYDTEASGFNYFEDKLGGISFCLEEVTAYYIQWNHIKNNQTAKDLLNYLFTIKQSIAHNGKFDEKFLISGGKAKYGFLGIENAITHIDTMLMHHLLRADIGHSLKLLAYLYTQYGGYDFELDQYVKDHKIEHYTDIPIEILGPYACMDARVTLKCFYEMKKLFELEENAKIKWLLENISLPLSNVFTDVELKGIRVNKEYLESYAIQLKEKKLEIENKCYQIAGRTFDINSTKQLRQVLTDLKMPQVKTTKTGAMSTDSDSMSILAKQGYPFAKIYLEWSVLNTKLKTFVGEAPKENTDDDNDDDDDVDEKKGLYKFIQNDDRVHCNFLISGTETGRISCLRPNLQNQPKDKEYRKVYKCPPGYQFIEADFSQAELRVAAVFSNDAAMKENFILGRDIHCTTICKIRPDWSYEWVFANKENPDSEVPKMRKKAKTVNFGVIYGESAYTLAEDLGITEEEANEFLSQYFKAFSGLARWREETQKLTHKNAMAVTLWGRRRPFKELEYPIGMSRKKLSGYDRQALNTPVQGSSSDYVLLSLINVNKMLKKYQFQSRIIATVHDSIVFEAKNEEIPIISPMIKNIMETTADIGVQMVVDISVGDVWGFPEKK